MRRKVKKLYVYCIVIMNRIFFKFLSDLWVFNLFLKFGIKLFYVLYLGIEYFKVEGFFDGI